MNSGFRIGFDKPEYYINVDRHRIPVALHCPPFEGKPGKVHKSMVDCPPNNKTDFDGASLADALEEWAGIIRQTLKSRENQ